MRQISSMGLSDFMPLHCHQFPGCAKHLQRETFKTNKSNACRRFSHQSRVDCWSAAMIKSRLGHAVSRLGIVVSR
jgi:hypothetical protein